MKFSSKKIATILSFLFLAGSVFASELDELLEEAEAGDGHSQYLLAKIHILKSGACAKDYAEALKWLEKSSGSSP